MMKDVQVGCVRFAIIAVLGLLANATPGHLRPAAAEAVRDAWDSRCLQTLQ
jgi:hypothetical protein